MDMQYFYTPQQWVVALYEKQGRTYREVAVIFSGELDPAQAFEILSEFGNCYPPRQAIDYGVEFQKVNPEVKGLEFEVRLIRQATNKVVGIVLWDADTVQCCLEDYAAKERRYYLVTAEIELSGEQLDEDFDDLDWQELIATGCFNPVDMQELDVLESDNQPER